MQRSYCSLEYFPFFSQTGPKLWPLEFPDVVGYSDSDVSVDIEESERDKEYVQPENASDSESDDEHKAKNVSLATLPGGQWLWKVPYSSTLRKHKCQISVNVDVDFRI